MHRHIYALALSLALAPSIALGQGASSPPAPETPVGHFLAPQQDNSLAWLPWQAATSAIGTTFNTLGTGRTAMMSVELEGDPIAVQLVFYNGSAAAWAVQHAAVSTSANYGPSSLAFGGVSAYDIAGTELNAFLPVTWTNGGTNSQPWNPNMMRYTGASATSGYQTISLALSGAAASTATTLNFASTTANAVVGAKVPTIGMFVSDGRGCIVPGTKVSGQTATTITIDTGVAAVGCLSGQNIYFTYQPVTGLSVNIAPTSNGVQGTLVYSDWVPVAPLPRTDTPKVGMSVSCSACAANTTITSFDQVSINLSSGLTGALSVGSTLTMTQTTTTIAAAQAPQAWLRVSSATNLQEGQIVTGSASIPANTYVTGVNANGIERLSAALSVSAATGTTLTFTNTTYNNTAGSTSDTNIKVQSTSGKKLLLMRAGVLSGSPTGWNRHNTIQDNQRYWGGYARFFQSTAANDSVNVITNSKNASGTGGVSITTPFYGVRYITRQRGTTVCTMGDSHMSGGGTSNSGNNFALVAANALSTQQRPVAAIQTANGGQSGSIYTPQVMQWIQNGTCSIVVAQINSQNNGNQVEVQGYIGMMQQMAQSAGVRTIFVADVARGMRNYWTWRVTADVNASTIVPINMRFGQLGWKNAGGSGYCVSGNGITGGTTFSYSMGDGFITLSAPMTIAKGTIISAAQCITLTTTSGSTSVTLSSAAPLTGTGIDLTGNANIAAGTQLSVTQDSTTGTLSANATGNGTAVATTYFQDPTTYTSIAMQGAGNWQQAATNSQPFYDANWCLMDPSDQGYFLPRYSWDGVHANDEGQQAIADGVPTAPFPGCPSFTTLLRRVIGN